jgi:hypothetical protein
MPRSTRYLACVTDEPNPWLLLRQTTGLSQREVERRLGWKAGHLSWIERGVKPKADQETALRRFYMEHGSKGTAA